MRDQLSKLTYDGPERLTANQLFRARLTVTLAVPMEMGGRIVIATRHVSDFGDPQMDRSGCENYITVSPEGRFTLLPANDWQRHPWNRGIDLQLTEGRLEEGDEVVVHLGEEGGGCPGYRCQSFVETMFRFRLGVLPRPEGEWQVVEEADSPGFEVLGAPAARVRVFVPNMTSTHRTGKVCVKAEDGYGNLAGAAGGELSLLLDDAVPFERVTLDPQRPAQTRLPMPPDRAWHRVTAASDDGRFYARSNPFGPSPVEGLHLYWGEIHSQSGLCDGTNSPAELYSYARHAAGLDFASVSSHDFELTPDEWEEVKDATRDAHRPGEFVTFLGYEWSGPHERGGDNNIYFLGDDGPLLYNGPWRGSAAWMDATEYIDRERTLTDVCNELGGRDVMIIPHCGGRRCNFDFYDARLMPLFEIHSCHRTYEHVAREAIDRGLRLGFIGGSDDHRGALGDSYPAARERFFSSYNGLVAVYAEELTRESLWEAFFARRTYATNGSRIVLDVHLDNVLMGGEMTAEPGRELTLKLRVWLDGLLDNVEIMRDRQSIAILQGRGNQVPFFETEYPVQALDRPACYWLRVRQTNGGEAWASPIWVSPPQENM